MKTTRTAVMCALVCLPLLAGGCGLFNSDRDELAAKLATARQDLAYAKADCATARKAFFDTEKDLNTTKTKLQEAQAALTAAGKKQQSLSGQLAAAKRELAAAMARATRATGDLNKAKADALKARNESAKHIETNKTLGKLNASLTKSANDAKAENDSLRKIIIDLKARIRELTKALEATKAPAR